MASASLVDALPAPVRVEGVVPSVTNADGSINDELLKRNMEATFAKYDERATGSSALKVKRRGAGKCKRAASSASLTLVQSGNAQTLYTANVKIGSPAQILPVLIDTGSSDLFVQTNGKTGTANFISAASSTFTDAGRNATLHFVSDSVTGEVVTDTVSLGGVNVPNQSFLVVEDANSAETSGNLGLSLAAQASKQIGTSFLESVRASGQLGELNKFALYLPRDGNRAELTFGGISSASNGRFASKIQVMYPAQLGRASPFLLPSFGLELTPSFAQWAIPLSIIFDNSGKAVWDATGTTHIAAAFVDSGSSVSYIPRAAAKAAHEAIPGAVRYNTTQVPLNGAVYDVDQYLIPCDSTATFGLGFDGVRRRNFDLDPRDTRFPFNENGVCQSSWFGVDIAYNGIPASIIGVPFLRSWYGIFNPGSANNLGAYIMFAPAPQ
ncbi:hypothetical protein JCM10295v2_002556 [Rhodotorula toruloides]